MLNLQQRIYLLDNLKKYILGNEQSWADARIRASESNTWFIPEFVDAAIKNIATEFLDSEKLTEWINSYNIPEETINPSNVGITMAGNIPLVGFHDFLCVFVSGHRQTIKLSGKDNVLLRHLVEKMTEWNGETANHLSFSEMLKGCDAYIATGSNNSARYFEYYFKKYPHIIRRNRTSVAILKGTEDNTALEKLADDVYMYFGLGCRNVTKIYVPLGYDFIPLLEAFKKYDRLADNHKYKHNYDFNLAIHLLNYKFYMTNSSILLSEDKNVFSPISQLNYEFYSDINGIYKDLNPENIQCIAGIDKMPLGYAQRPSLADYADGIDTMHFLKKLNSNQQILQA